MDILLKMLAYNSASNVNQNNIKQFTHQFINLLIIKFALSEVETGS